MINFRRVGGFIGGLALLVCALVGHLGYGLQGVVAGLLGAAGVMLLIASVSDPDGWDGCEEEEDPQIEEHLRHEDDHSAAVP